MPLPHPNASVPFNVLHQDEHILIVDKPAGVVTLPGLGHRDDSLLNGLFAHCAEELTQVGEVRDWGALHRLDRDTSGVVVFALTATAYDALRAQFEARSVMKRYLTLTTGKPPQERGIVDVPLAEVRRGDLKISTVDRSPDAEPALTRYRSLGRGHGRTLLQVELVTGRLHQIRVHMAHIGCAVVNDPIYRVDLPPKTSKPPAGRAWVPLALHSWDIQFSLPDGKPVTARAPIPAHLTSWLAEAGIPVPPAPVQ